MDELSGSKPRALHNFEPVLSDIFSSELRNFELHDLHTPLPALETGTLPPTEDPHFQEPAEAAQTLCAKGRLQSPAEAQEAAGSGT